MAKAPLRDTLKHHWREVLIAAGLKVVETAPFYIFSTFVVSYATTTLSYQKSQALESVTLGALVATVMIPLMGLLSDKVGRQKMYTLERGAAGGCLSSRGSCCSTPAPAGASCWRRSLPSASCGRR